MPNHFASPSQPRPQCSTSSGLTHGIPTASRTETDRKLASALHRFRQDKTTLLYGPAIATDLGGCVLMGDSVIDRLIDCVRAGIIKKGEDVVRETEWRRAAEYAGEVYAILERHVQEFGVELPANPTVPQSAPTSSPLCGACKQSGHTCTYLYLSLFIN